MHTWDILGWDKVAELHPQWKVDMTGARRWGKLVKFLEGDAGWGGGEGVLLTGVPLCLSLAGSDRTVLVGQQNLLQLTDL